MFKSHQLSIKLRHLVARKYSSDSNGEPIHSSPSHINIYSFTYCVWCWPSICPPSVYPPPSPPSPLSPPSTQHSLPYSRLTNACELTFSLSLHLSVTAFTGLCTRYRVTPVTINVSCTQICIIKKRLDVYQIQSKTSNYKYTLHPNIMKKG